MPSGWWLPKRDELREEMRQHLEEKTQQLMREGRTRVQAEREASIAFGNRTFIEEESRAVWRWPLANATEDVRYAVRLFRKSPGFALAITLTLTLGIGANFAVFNTLYSLLLQALPVQEPGRLVHLAVQPAGPGAFGMADAPANLNLPIIELIQRRAHSFEGVLGWFAQDYKLTEGAQERTIPGALVSGNAFSVLGLKPAAGRLLTSQDDQPGGGKTGWAVMISYGFWQAHYGGTEAAVGSKLRIAGLTATVAGVAPRGFDSVLLDNHPSVYLPLEFKGAVDGHSNLHQSAMLWLTCLARLSQGVGERQAAAEMNTLWPGILDETVPPKMRHVAFIEGLRFQVWPGRTGWSYLRLAYGTPLKVLQGLVAIVFLLCCTNIGGLCVARAIARQQEFETRSALGAGRGRLMRQVLTESLLLTLPGALTAVLLAWTVSHLLMPLMGQFGMQIALQFTVWIWVGVLPAACLSATLFGLFPAILVGKFAESPGVGRVAVRVSEPRAVWFYLPVQIAMSLILVIVAGLFTATLSHLRYENLGFETTGVFLTSLDLSKSRLSETDRIGLERQLTARLADEPGVYASGFALNTPLNGSLSSNEFAVLKGQEAAARPVTLDTNVVSFGYFKATGTLLLRGREFRDGSTGECIVNQAATSRLFRGEPPVGRSLRVFENQLNGDIHQHDCLVVGEVENAKYDTLREAPPATVYRVWSSRERTSSAIPTLVIRARSLTVARKAFGHAMGAVAPQATQNDVISFAEQVDGSVQRERMLVVLSNFFAILALAISAMGVFGVTAWMATRRTREIGLRSALGATQGNIMRTFLVQALRTVVVGSIVGALAALFVTKWLHSLLYGVRAGDPALLLTSIGVLSCVVMVAAYLPARQAALADPMQALRQE